VPPGRRLGRYHLIGRLGQGSEGEVWEAVRTSGGLQAVALKVLSPELSDDPERRAAFLRGAELGRRLASPALLTTLDAGEEGDFVFLAMPLVDGPTLAGAIARRIEVEAGTRVAAGGGWWLTLDRTGYVRAMTRLLAGVARAVASAHSCGVAHRDIKPSNILLDRAGPERPFLGDFGVGSYLVRGGPRERPARESEPGTPLYMPPERLLGGESDPVLGDVFALGATLAEALTLTPPRPVPRGMPRSCLPAYLAAADPSPLRASCPWLPRRLEAVALRAMARDPAARHPSAAALAEDLDRLTAGRTAG
jgi:serine/threonine-protein kinase